MDVHYEYTYNAIRYINEYQYFISKNISKPKSVCRHDTCHLELFMIGTNSFTIQHEAEKKLTDDDKIEINFPNSLTTHTHTQSSS